MKLINATTGAILVISAAGMLLGFGWQRTTRRDARWWRDAQKLAAKDSADSDLFGQSVAIAGETILVGAPLCDAAGANSGAAHLFQRGQYASVVKLGADDTAAFGELGYSVALSGRTALVGKPGDDGAGENSGAAYLYRNDGQGHWSRVVKLLAIGAAAGEWFGSCVALNEDGALIGAGGPQRRGAAYIFQDVGAGNWQQTAKFSSDKGESKDCFGSAVAIGSNLAAVGASESGGYRGAAYLFERDSSGGWIKIAKLTASDARFFGSAVALWDRTVLVGAPADVQHCGAVYLFQETEAENWQQVAKLTPRPAESGNRFGDAVAINGETIAVGAPLESGFSGAVYLFQANRAGVWQQIARIKLPDELQVTWFGTSLAVSNDALLVGAKYGNGNTPKSGAAYVFRLDNSEPASNLVHASQ